MFRRHIFATALILIAIAGGAVFRLLRHSEAEHLALQEMVGSGEDDIASCKALHQRRLGVRRDILHGFNKPLRTVIFSDAAELCLEYRDKDAIEQLTHPYGYSQELVEPLYQIVRYFEAEKGSYHHKNHAVTLINPTVARYYVEGTRIPDDLTTLPPLMTGGARVAEVQVAPVLGVAAEDVYGESVDQQITFSSRSLTYQKEILHLTGEVCVKSPKASIYAGEILMVRPTNGDRLERTTLTGGVVINLSDGSQLLGDSVDIDFQMGLALLRARTNDFVQWRQPDTSGNAMPGQQREPIVLLSRTLIAHFDPEWISDTAQPLNVMDVVAEGDVVVLQEGAWTAKGDVMVFKQANASHGRLITLKALQSDHLCLVEGANGARLNTSQLTYDLDKGIVHLAGIDADQAGMIWLKNNHDVVMYVDSGLAATGLLTIEADGDTELLVSSPETAIGQKLISHGAIVVDHQACCATFRSPIGSDGLVSRTDQVIFSDGMAEMHANTVVLKYSVENSHVASTHLVADGNVCLRGALGQASMTSVAQYAICDRLEYWPEGQRLLLSSGEGRVAMLDKASGIAVSAPAVEVRRNPDTGKNIIKGIGDVRFSLLDRDYQKLRERFSIDQLDTR